MVYYRHVQVNNESAIKFYQKFGFEIVETRDQYYKRIEPAGAHVLEKNVRSEIRAAALKYNNSQTVTSSSITTNQTPSATNAAVTNHLQNGIDTHTNNSNHHQTKSKVTA